MLIYTNYTNYKHYNLEPNYKYYYKISAVYSYGESFNNPVYAFTTLFSYPVYISYSSDNGFSTKIWWSFVKGATAYKIYYSPNQYGPYSLIHTEYSNGTNVFEHKDLLPAKSNYYKISALNNTYESPMSPYYQVMTKTMLVGTIAGNGYSGFADGDGISAKFYYPEDVVFDINGNAYIADKLNHRIRKITPDSNVSTFSGSGSQGSDDGPATYACFNCPMGLTIDNSGIIYVADSGSHKIRKVNPDGSVQTIAGSGLAGGVNGNGVSASFNFPSDLVIASNGTIYVADTYNHVIRAIDTSYNVTTFAGTMGSEGYINDYGTSAKFNLPKGICIDKNNEYLYVSDTSNHVIRKINIATKQVTTIAGKGIPGYMDDIGTNAQFNSPEKIAIDTENRLYVVDRLNHKIRVIYPDGAVKTLAGFGGTALHRDGPLDVGPSDSAAFNYPSGIGIYNLNIYPIGKIFITDTMDHRIRIIYYVP